MRIDVGLTLLAMSALATAAQGVRRSVDETALETTTVPDAPRHDAVVGLLGIRGVMCSGTLVHQRAVLTAKHCRTARRVVFGSSARDPVLVRDVRGWRFPPNSAVDAALVLIDAVDLEPYAVRTQAAVAPRSVRVVGFGAPPTGDGAFRARRTYFDARLRGWGCEPTNAAETGCIPGLELVIPRSAGADSCEGDSGGPVLERDGKDWRAVALTSRAVANAVLPCGDGGIYVRTDAIASWLQRELKRIGS